MFRVWLYLRFKNFLFDFFLRKDLDKKKNFIINNIYKQSKKLLIFI